MVRTQCDIKHFIVEQGNLKNNSNILLLIKAVLPLISEKKDEDIILGIGVPISTSIERMKILSLKLKGEIKFKIKNDATKDIIEITKVIKKVFIMPESYGTYYKVGSSFKEKIAIDAIVISLDLITEIMTIYNGNLMKNASRNLINASYFALLSKIITSLQQQTGNIIHTTSILQNIRENQNNIVIAGKTYDIIKAKEPAFANAIVFELMIKEKLKKLETYE